MTREELIIELRRTAKENKILVVGDGLYEECKKIFNKDDFDPTDPGKMASVLEKESKESEQKKKEIEEEVERVEEEKNKAKIEAEEREKSLESRSLNSADLKKILEEYDKYREGKDKEEIADKIIKNNPSFRQIKINDILEAIETKIKIENELLAKGKSKEEADKLSNEILIVKEELEERDLKGINESELTVIAEEIVEGKEINIESVLDKVGIKNTETREVFVDIQKDISATRNVNEKVEGLVNNLTNEVIKISNPKDETARNKIKEVVRVGVMRVVNEPTNKLIDNEVIDIAAGTRENIAQKIEKVLSDDEDENKNIKLSENQKIELNIEIKRVDGVLEKFLDSESETIDHYRGKKLRDEVFSRLTEKGVSIKEAGDKADFVRGLSFPNMGESVTKIEIEAARIMEENGYGRGNEESKIAIEKAVNIRRLISGSENIQETVNKISELKDTLDGIEGFKSWKNLAQELNKDKGLIKTLEFVKKISKFQERFNGPGSKMVGQLGRILNIPTWQEFGIKMATRFGGKTVGAMATHLAHFSELGLGQGVKSIAGQFFAKGMIAPIKAGVSKLVVGLLQKAGIKAVAEAVLVGTGPVGWVVAAALLAIDLIVSVGKKLLGGIKKKLDSLAESLNLNLGVSKFLKENLGGFLGGIVDIGVKVGGGMIMIMLAIPMFLAAVTLPIWLIVGAIVAIPLYNHLQTATTQASSLVAPKGMDDTQTAVNPNITITPGIPIEGAQCDKSTKLTLFSQYEWNDELIYYSGCGPTSVAMMLNKRFGSTPKSVTYSPPYLGKVTNLGSTFEDAKTAMIDKIGLGPMLGSCSEESIKKSICAGKVVMVNANVKQTKGTGGHFFLAVAVKDNKIISFDPAFSEDTNTPFNSTGRGSVVGNLRECLFVDESAL